MNNNFIRYLQNKIENAGGQTDISGKVDKVTGKGLSTNDLTNELKSNYDAAYTRSQNLINVTLTIGTINN